MTLGSAESILLFFAAEIGLDPKSAANYDNENLT